VTPPEANRATPVTAPLAACDALADQRSAREMRVVTPVTPVTALSGNGDDPGDIPEFLAGRPASRRPRQSSEKTGSNGWRARL
jgi:hypothetical protein